MARTVRSIWRRIISDMSAVASPSRETVSRVSNLETRSKSSSGMYSLESKPSRFRTVYATESATLVWKIASSSS